MARKIAIKIFTAKGYCEVTDYDDVSFVINNTFGTGMGAFSFDFPNAAGTIMGLTETASQRRIQFAFDEVALFQINDVDVVTLDLFEMRDALAPYFFSVGIGGFQFYKEVVFTNSQLLNNLDWSGGASPLVVLPAIADSYYSSMLFCHELTYATAGFATASQAGFYSHVPGAGSATLLVSLPNNALNYAGNRVVPNIQPQMSSTNVMPVYGVNEQIIYKLANSANQTTGGGSVKIKVWYNVQRFG